MLEGVALFVVGIGALLVSIVSLLHMAWLAVLLPLALAGGAAYAIVKLNSRRSRRVSPAGRAGKDAGARSRRIAA
jgi:membrane protein implicated in regulation of membrane protease activity